MDSHPKHRESSATQAARHTAAHSAGHPTGAVAGPLLELARLYGVETVYRDSRGRWKASPVEAVIRVLRALGAPLEDPARGRRSGNRRDASPSETAIERAILRRGREVWGRVLEPVIVAWDGAWPTTSLRVQEDGARGDAFAGSRGGHGGHLMVELVLEDGEHRRAEIDASTLPVRQRVSIDGRRYVEYSLPLKLLSGSRSRLPLDGTSCEWRQAPELPNRR